MKGTWAIEWGASGPPGSRDGDAGMPFEKRAALVTTHSNREREAGRREMLEFPSSQFVHEDARLEIRIEMLGEEPRYFALGTGPLSVNGEPLGPGRTLEHGDQLRVKDHYYAFLSSGREADYYELIYHLTIRDFPSELHRLRYLKGVLEKDLEWAARYDQEVLLASMRIELEQRSSLAWDPSHDWVRDFGRAWGLSARGDRCLGRAERWEAVLLAVREPAAGFRDEVEARCRAFERAHAGVSLHTNVCVGRGGDDATELLARVRAWG